MTLRRLSVTFGEHVGGLTRTGDHTSQIRPVPALPNVDDDCEWYDELIEDFRIPEAEMSIRLDLIKLQAGYWDPWWEREET